jgi:hypothetical protein
MLINDDIGVYLNVELLKKNLNITRQIVCMFDPFLCLLWNFEPKRAHNVLRLMLDP